MGTTSAAKKVTVKNISTSTVTLVTITSSGEFSETGSGTPACANGVVLNAGKTCTLSVTFSPALGASGSVSGAVVVSDTASVGQQVLDVKGTAALPLTFAPTSLTFAAQTVSDNECGADCDHYQQPGYVG